MLAVRPAQLCKRLGTTISAVIGLAIAAVMAWQSCALVAEDVAFTRLETEVSFWGRGEYIPSAATLATTEAALTELLAAAPRQPDYLALAAYLYSWRGNRPAQTAEAQNYRRRAVDAQYAAQVSRPAYRQGWQNMVVYAGRVEGLDALGNQASRWLAALGAAVQPALPDATTE